MVLLPAACAAVFVVGTAGAARADVFSGTVTDGSGGPLEGAHVTVNWAARAVTAADGSFSVDTPRLPTGDVVVAALPGWLTARTALTATDASTALAVKLDALPSDPATFMPETPYRCTECHVNFANGWSGRGGFGASAHAHSANNAHVLDIFRGTASGRTDAASCSEVSGSFEAVADASGATVMRCYVGAGVLPDDNANCGHAGQPRCDDTSAPASARPATNSDCAGCHTPGAAMRLPAATDLGVAELLPQESAVTCAACHRLREILDPNLPGVLRGANLVRGTDAGGDPLGLGPLDDAASTQMRASWSPLHTTSLVCAPCHQDTYAAAGLVARFPDGVPSEQTYAEWLESPYASGAREASCQSCHMKTLADLGITPSFPAIGAGGPMRTAAEMHVHDFPPLTTADELGRAVVITTDAHQDGASLVVSTSVTNRGVGHGFPSGVTSRQVLLVVTAETSGGALVESGGEVLPLYAGSYGSGHVVSASGSTLTVDRDLDATSASRVVRFWTETGAYRDHQSFGVLRPLTTAQKGWRATEALGHATIVAVRGREFDLDGPVPAAATGAFFAVGDDRRLAGAAGVGFAKVNVAADGTPNVPFWRATDLVYDSRLAPDETHTAEHRFALPPGTSGDVTVRARLVYRKTFIELAAQRGWRLDDAPAGEATAHATVLVPGVDAGVPDASADAGVPDAGHGGNGGGCCATDGVRGGSGVTVLALLGALGVLRRARRRSRCTH